MRKIFTPRATSHENKHLRLGALTDEARRLAMFHYGYQSARVGLVYQNISENNILVVKWLRQKVINYKEADHNYNRINLVESRGSCPNKGKCSDCCKFFKVKKLEGGIGASTQFFKNTCWRQVLESVVESSSVRIWFQWGKKVVCFLFPAIVQTLAWQASF